MNTITRTAEQRLKIAAGQTFRAWVETDAMLIVTSGTLMLHAPPMSLAETLVALRMRLGPETAQRFERSGRKWL